MTRTITLADPLPCCARAGWGYCERPATVALAELQSTATGRRWLLIPLCALHQVKPMKRGKRK